MSAGPPEGKHLAALLVSDIQPEEKDGTVSPLSASDPLHSSKSLQVASGTEMVVRREIRWPKAFLAGKGDFAFHYLCGFGFNRNWEGRILRKRELSLKKPSPKTSARQDAISFFQENHRLVRLPKWRLHCRTTIPASSMERCTVAAKSFVLRIGRQREKWGLLVQLNPIDLTLPRDGFQNESQFGKQDEPAQCAAERSKSGGMKYELETRSRDELCGAVSSGRA